MRWFRFPVNDTYDLENSTAGEVSITMVGTGTAQLGYLDPDDAFRAYTDTESTMTDGDSIVIASGVGTNLKVLITGAAADTAVGVAQIR